MTAGTIFDRTRTPLTVWFTACWLFATGKDGISALSLKRVLEIGSYQTAWAMLHRLRSVLVRPGRDLLSGTVQVDEPYIGGAEPGLAGGRAKGKKVLTVIAVEVLEPRGLGRCRISPLADASGESLHGFVMDHVEPDSTIVTDGWPPLSGTGAARARPALGATIPTSYCPPCTASPRWPSGGCWVRIREPPKQRGHPTSLGRTGRGGRPSTRWRMRFTPVKWISPSGHCGQSISLGACLRARSVKAAQSNSDWGWGATG